MERSAISRGKLNAIIDSTGPLNSLTETIILLICFYEEFRREFRLKIQIDVERSPQSKVALPPGVNIRIIC